MSMAIFERYGYVFCCVSSNHQSSAFPQYTTSALQYRSYSSTVVSGEEIESL
jgi:hypothetical protein